MAFKLSSYRPHIDGVRASNHGAWKQASQQIALAANRDPALAFYWFQSAFAQGMAALNGEAQGRDATSLEQAIERYQHGLAIEPSFGTNWANLGVLSWVHENREQAIQALEKAVELAPREAAFWVTLGRMYEAELQHGKAAEAYAQALNLRPYWWRSYFFRATSLRKDVTADWRAGKVVPPIHALEDPPKGWELLAAGEPDEAVRSFQEQLGLNTPAAYYGLGRALIDQGHFEEALVQLRIARFLPTRDGWLRAMIDLSMGEAHQRMGRCDQALKAYLRSFSALDATTSLGVGMLGISDYGWYVYNRASIAADLLPGVEYLRYTDSVTKGMLAAADCYQTLGQTSEAELLATKAYQLTPDLDAVMEQGGNDLD
jgi:tetratricopeptide (TPR) repeat protein